MFVAVICYVAVICTALSLYILRMLYSRTASPSKNKYYGSQSQPCTQWNQKSERSLFGHYDGVDLSPSRNMLKSYKTVLTLHKSQQQIVDQRNLLHGWQILRSCLVGSL
jgi:hypothetical protein